MSILFFWVVTPCRLVGRYQRFGGTTALKMKAVCSSETLASTYKSAWHHNTEDQHRHFHHRENLKFEKVHPWRRDSAHDKSCVAGGIT
jgi:hypothetical protein